MFGDIVRNLRNARNLNQVQLARELGVSKQTISNWENNNILPSIEMLTSIARFFSVSTDYLLELDSRRYIEVTDLSLEEISHIQQLINDIKKTNWAFIFIRDCAAFSFAVPICSEFRISMFLIALIILYFLSLYNLPSHISFTPSEYFFFFAYSRQTHLYFHPTANYTKLIL